MTFIDNKYYLTGEGAMLALNSFPNVICGHIEDAINYKENDWDDILNLNLKTLFFLSQSVAKEMIEQKSGGKIINIASMLSYQGGIRVPAYTASKSGVKGLTKALANEWAKPAGRWGTPEDLAGAVIFLSSKAS